MAFIPNVRLRATTDRPDTPPAGKVTIYADEHDNVSVVNSDGEVTTLTESEDHGTVTSITFVSGTGRTVSTLGDRQVWIPITYDAHTANATCAVAIAPTDASYTTLYTVTVPNATMPANGLILPIDTRVPKGWYLKLTVTNATIGTGHYLA